MGALLGRGPHPAHWPLVRGSRIVAVAGAVAAVAAGAAHAGERRAAAGIGLGFTHPVGVTVAFAGAGSSQPWLTGLPAADGQRVAWSPDGSRLAFVCGDFQLCVAGGGKVRTLTQTSWPRRWQYDGDPAWSPDGKTLAFDAGSAGSYRIYLVSSGGGAPHALVRRPLGHEELPAWSPNGKRLVFDAGRGLSDTIYVVARNGRHLRRLTGPKVNAHSAAWSSNGKSIAFARATKHGTAIDVMTLSSRRIRALTPGTSRDDHPAWSPDGQTLAFDSNRSGPIGVWTVPVAGGTPTQVDSGRHGPDLFPVWSPRGGSWGSVRAYGPADGDARLVSIFLAWSFKVGADVFDLHAGHAAAIAGLAHDAASGKAAVGARHPADARGRRFRTAVLLALSRASVAASDYRKMLAALHGGHRSKAFDHAKAALRELTRFGARLSKAEAIAGLA